MWWRELIKQKLISTRLRSCWPIKMRMARHLYSFDGNLLQFQRMSPAEWDAIIIIMCVSFLALHYCI